MATPPLLARFLCLMTGRSAVSLLIATQTVNLFAIAICHITGLSRVKVSMNFVYSVGSR